ncbi:hypothetical protein [uncultured Clostridium sp.]|mgnify:CR=1 FL=1|nr:hypothetical protein [uncultured Clostridium sp.]
MNINYNIIYQCSQSTMNHRRDFAKVVNQLMETGNMEAGGVV